MKKLSLITIFCLGLIFSGFAQAPVIMTPVVADEVPTEVLMNMQKLYPESEVLEWLLFDRIYAAKIEDEAMIKYVHFNDEGLLIEERHLIDWQDAPEALKRGKNKTQFKYWEVTKLYGIHKNGKIDSYFMKLTSEKNEIKTIYFDSGGNLESKSNSGR